MYESKENGIGKHTTPHTAYWDELVREGEEDGPVDGYEEGEGGPAHPETDLVVQMDPLTVSPPDQILQYVTEMELRPVVCLWSWRTWWLLKCEHVLESPFFSDAYIFKLKALTNQDIFISVVHLILGVGT